MRLAIMQPYLFPYIGYFQLIHAVDAFVVYDDVNFINRGWINRNNILANGNPELFTLQLMGASQNKLINEISVGSNRQKLVKTIKQRYSKAPKFADVFPMVEQIIMNDESNLAVYLSNSLLTICDYLRIKAKWFISSELSKDNTLRGQEKILSICQLLGTSHYINPPGGRPLYDRELFSNHGIKLSFINSRCEPYSQFGDEFAPYLSIIDVMMFNDQEQCSKLLQEYSLD